ncbi:MAG: class I SAM-dependent methyltransferase [Alphaproteobacteria bacterium]|nr:class I SAM-dependent methyltransferase [Alphaproteobacteria bacterium]
MTTRSIGLPDPLYDYYRGIACRESPLLARLRAETAPMKQAGMQIAPEQGAFMALLVRLLGVRRYLEIGTFTGYSSLAVGLAMPAEGRLTCLDVSAEWTAIARRYWAEAGLTDRVELRLAPALESLATLEREGGAGHYDMAFIDADKANYATYLDHALRLVRRGGLILFDNTLWSGRVADAAASDADTVALRALNAALQRDARLEAVLVPIGDGLTLARIV